MHNFCLHISFVRRFIFICAGIFFFHFSAVAQKDKKEHKDTLSVHQFHHQIHLKNKKKQPGKLLGKSLHKHSAPPPKTATPPASGTPPAGTPTATTVSAPLTPKVLNPEYAVFGWHPYWMENAYESYDYKLLSHIAYFSYEVNPNTGQAKSYHDWLTTPMIDSAQAINPACKILLTVSCFGNDNGTFLGNSDAQTTLITTVISLLDKRHADGVNIDFEGIPAGYETDFSIFIANFTIALHAKGYIMTIAIPAIDRNSIYDIGTLNTYADLYILMGYGYYGSFSSKPGPVSPLMSSDQWGTASIAQSVQYYFSQKLPREKLLIGLPYYGAFWQTQKGANGTDSLTFLEYLTYTSYMEQVGATGQLDSLSICCFSDQQKEDILNHYWGEDTSSLSAKFDWVIMNQVKGIGIWALGYDDGRHELWELIGQKFGTDPGTVAKDSTQTTPSDSTKTAGGDSGGEEEKMSKFEQGVQFFYEYTYSILFAFLVLFLCFITGFLSLYLKEENVALLKEKKIFYPGLIISATLLNALIGLSIYFTYNVPIIIIFFFSLLAWTVVVLGYFLVYSMLEQRDIP